MTAPFPELVSLQYTGSPFGTLEGAFLHALRVADETGQKQRIALRTVGTKAGYRYRRWVVTPGLMP